MNEWLRIAEGEAELPTEFQRMIAAWEAIVVWQRAHCGQHVRDREMNDRLVVELPLTALTDDPTWIPQVCELKALCPIKEIRNDQETGVTQDIHDATDWRGIVDTLYLIRCNLLHGGKNPLSEDDLTKAGHAAKLAAFVARHLPQ